MSRSIRFAGLALVLCLALTSLAAPSDPQATVVTVSEADHWRYVAEFRLLQLYEAWHRLGQKTARDVETAQIAFNKIHNDIARAYGLEGDGYLYNVNHRGFVPKKKEGEGK